MDKTMITKFEIKQNIKMQIINEQHKELFNLVEKLDEILQKHISRKELKTILFDLFNCIKRHFEYEENYMKNINYPLFYAHRLKHKNILKSMINFVRYAKTTNDLKEKLYLSTKQWLLEHIYKDDVKIYDFADSKKRNIFNLKKSLEKIYLYTCSCRNKTYSIKYDVHKKIAMHFISITCQFCKQSITFQKELV